MRGNFKGLRFVMEWVIRQKCWQHLSVTFQVSCSSCPVAPAAIVTTLPGSRIIRQSSQPEASAAPCCGVSCVHHAGAAHPSTSLRQLRDHDSGGIAGIAADSLRINGAMRNFRQVWLMRAPYNPYPTIHLYSLPKYLFII